MILPRRSGEGLLRFVIIETVSGPKYLGSLILTRSLSVREEITQREQVGIFPLS